MQLRTLSAPGLRVTCIFMIAGAILASFTLPAAAAPPDATKPQSPIISQVEAPRPQLTAKWWQSFMSLSGGASSLDRCDIRSGNIVFLAGISTEPEPSPRQCTVKPNQSLLIPIINVECSTIEGNGDTLAALNDCASHQFADNFTNLKLVIDGSPLADPARLRVNSGLFKFTMALDNPFGTTPADPDGSGPLQAPALPAKTQSVSDGYWALVPPLPPGSHTITFGGEFPTCNCPGSFTTEVTYNLTVTK